MKTKDLIAMAFKNLGARKLRTFLTVLGVVIGCTSIVVMMSLGYGMTKQSEDWVKSMGNLTDITIYGKTNPTNGKNEVLNEKLVAELAKKPHVKNVFGILNLQGDYSVIANRKYDGYAEIVGIDPANMEAYGLELADGKYPNAGDGLNAVFGSRVKDSFGYMAGNTYRQLDGDLKKIKFELVKVNYNENGMREVKQTDKKEIKYSGELVESQDWQKSSAIFLPIQAVRKILLDENDKLDKAQQDKDLKTKYNRIVVVMEDIDYVKDLKNELVDNEGYQAEAMTDWLDSMKQDMLVTQAIFGGIGAVSLLVAAIGISNTMVMSIQERTKEIGIMKVIGASIKDIRALFLLEAAAIGLLGGIVGLILSYGASFLLNNLLGGLMGGMGMGETKISIIPIYLSVAALVFTSLIGVISGYFPARKAMKISALDAMRYE